jgi:hypothetical protein
MKKNFISLFCGCLIVLIMFVFPSNGVQAHEGEEGCSCNDFTLLLGAEKNKNVSDLLKSEGFKTKKKELQEEGYKWHGVNDAEVAKHNLLNIIIVAVPFTNVDGIEEMFVFQDGEFLYSAPEDSEGN